MAAAVCSMVPFIGATNPWVTRIFASAVHRAGESDKGQAVQFRYLRAVAAKEGLTETAALFDDWLGARARNQVRMMMKGV